MYFHGSANDCSNAPKDCQVEFKAANDDNNLVMFNRRCKEMNNSDAFGKRCELCCKGQNTGTI